MMTISNGSRIGSWHVSENMRVPSGQVLTFTVDGHELAWLVDVLDKGLKLTGQKIIYPTERLTPVL